MRKPRLTESEKMERLDRQRLVELRAAERTGDMSVLPELEEDCFELHPKEIGQSTLTLALAVTEARCRWSGPWADETFSARGNLVGIWLARMRTVGRDAPAVRRAYAAWLASIEEAAGTRLSEMLCRLAFWVVVAELDTGDEGVRLARRALDLATTPLEEAKALTEIGHALMFAPERRGDAEAALADAMLRAPDGPTRWQAQYHHAYLAHAEGKMDVAIERYLALFRLMVEVPGAIGTDVGWAVAVDLLGFMHDAKDRRVDDVQRTYDATRDRDALTHVPPALSPQT